MGEDGGLIAGHARILAARQPGIAEIPVMVAARKKDGLSNSGMPRLAERIQAVQVQRMLRKASGYVLYRT